MIKRFLLGFCIGYFLCNNLYAQREFLVTIDPALGTHLQLDSIPGIRQIQIVPKGKTFDKNHHHFIFIGKDSLNQLRLYTVDVLTVSILSSPLFPVLQNMSDHLSELYYDNNSDTLYGLYWNSIFSTEYLVWIDQSTGVNTNIGSISGIQTIGIGQNAFDEINHRFIFTGMSGGTARLYTMDASTGATIYNPIFPSNVLNGAVVDFQMDNSTGILYAVYFDNSNSTEYFGTVNPSDGSFQIINSLPGVTLAILGEYAFDEINHHFLFETSTTSQTKIITVNVANGNIISSPYFPNLTYPENIVQFQFDNSTGILYGLNWDTSGISINDGIEEFNNYSISLSPNPAATEIKLTNLPHTENQISIYNLLGQCVYRSSTFQKSGTSIGSATINIADLPSGIYLLAVSNAEAVVTKKFVKE